MKQKKVGILLILLVFLSTSMVSAINLEIEKEIINEIIITELNNSAFFELSIKNLEESDNFQLYSLVGVDIKPREIFRINSEETKNITVEITALESVKKISGYFTFVYKIKSSTGIQEDRLTIKIVNLKDAMHLSADNINPDDNKAVVHLQNKENLNFDDIEAEFSSVFFEFEEEFSLPALGKKSFAVDLDQQRFGTLIAGPYILNADIKINNTEETLESTIKFLEKSGT
jgi:hypothetical protein